MMDAMNKEPVFYLEKSLELLGKWLPLSPVEMLRHYQGEEGMGDMEVSEDIHGYVYCIFSWAEDAGERIVLLLYDENEKVIADLSAVHCDVMTLLYSQELYDALSEESDWMYLEHYTLCASMFADIPYPGCAGEWRQEREGEALLFSNAYVQKRFRRQGIFTAMMNMTRDFALRCASGNTRLYAAISLDPDVAVYGEDARKSPYYYSFEKDEPVRMENCAVIAKLGFTPLRLEETSEDPDADGTKLWFAVRAENDMIIDVDENCSI